MEIPIKSYSRSSRTVVIKTRAFNKGLVNGFLEYTNIVVRTKVPLQVSFGDNSVSYEIWENTNKIPCEEDVFMSQTGRIKIRVHVPKKSHVNLPEKIRIVDLDLKERSERRFDGNNGMLPNILFNSIYLINLDRRLDKMNRVKKSLENQGIEWFRASAIDGLTLKEDKNRNMSEKACLLTHIEVLQFAYQSNPSGSIVLILEDDVMFHKDFKQMLVNMPNKEDWDMLYLGSSKQPNSWNQIEFVEDKEYYKSRQCNGTFAYAVRRDFIPTIVEYLERSVNFGLPIDRLYHHIQKRYRCCTMFPNLVVSDVSISDIRDGRDMEEYGRQMYWSVNNYS